MKLKVPGVPKFDHRNIASLWDSKVESLDALRVIIPGSTLVALDTEATNDFLREVGLAFLSIDGEIPCFEEGAGTRSFYEQHDICAYTVQNRERISEKWTRNRPLFGKTRLVNADEVYETLADILSKHKEKLILVGFDL